MTDFLFCHIFWLLKERYYVGRGMYERTTDFIKYVLWSLLFHFPIPVNLYLWSCTDLLFLITSVRRILHQNNPLFKKSPCPGTATVFPCSMFPCASIERQFKLCDCLSFITSFIQSEGDENNMLLKWLRSCLKRVIVWITVVLSLVYVSLSPDREPYIPWEHCKWPF